MRKNVYGESKLTLHENKLKSLLNREVTAPVYIRIKPDNRCNHNCFYCGYEIDIRRNIMDRTSRIPFEKMLEILKDFKEIGVKAVTYSGGGEPLLYPHIVDIMKKTLEYGIDLSIITNGQLLNGKRAEVLKNAKWVRISASESDEKTFSETRGKPKEWFHILKENIRDFARTKNPECELGINFVVQKKNAEQVYRSIKYFKGLGVNHIKITPAWMPNFLKYHQDIKEIVEEQIKRAREDLIDENFQVYDTYEKDFEHCGLNKRSYERCVIIEIVPVIGADCNVYFCHDKAYSQKGILGSLKNQSFKDLWYSQKTKERFMNFDPRIECVHHCANDTKNIIALQIITDLGKLENFKPKDDRHKNFI